MDLLLILLVLVLIYWLDPSFFGLGKYVGVSGPVGVGALPIVKVPTVVAVKRLKTDGYNAKPLAGYYHNANPIPDGIQKVNVEF